MKQIWVVTAHRNTLSQHSYVVGLYEAFEDARKAGGIEARNRGGKYVMDIKKYFLNKLPEEIMDSEI